MRLRKSWILAALAGGLALVAQQSSLFPVLLSTVLPGRQQGGFYLVPTNQLIRPWGQQTLIPGRPVELALDSQKRLLAILNWRSVMLADASSGAPLDEIKPRSTSYTGLAFRPGDRELWASLATRNGPDALMVAALSEIGRPAKVEYVELPGHPVPTGIAFSQDGQQAFVAFSRNNSLAVVDTGTRRVLREIETGIAPFAVVYSPRHKRIFVSNRGGRRPKPGETTAPSSGTQVLSDPKSGYAATGTVSVIELPGFNVREVAVGLAPSGMALSPDEATLAVANGHSDTVSLLDTRTLARTDVKIPAYPESFAGSQPIAVAFAPDGKTLYVACGGNNAIAVVQKTAKGWQVAGALPTGWFPSGLAVDGKGDLWVVNVKGVGNTANPTGGFNSRQYEGSLLRLPAPLPGQLAAGTREVRAANSPRWTPAGGVANLRSLGIQHVVFIIKENRTYDQILGDMGKGNGDPKLVMYGREVTPNHHALADRYVLLDNFYTGGAISFDGHHWLMQGFVSDYVERAFGASPRGYAWNMADALTISPAGFFWQGARRPLDVRIYGEFCLPARWNPETQSVVDITESELLPWSEYWRLYREGKWRAAVGSRPGVPALAPYICPRYPNSTTSIPDQIRAEVFLEELASWEKTGRMPNLIILHLNNNHTAGTRPGFPTPRAMVADNDLALGRVVEALSKSRFWPKMLILSVEDDAQDGIDHVDGRRTVALAIGPYVRRNAVDSNYYNHGSMVRTIQEIFGIEPRTRFLKAARPMTSIFTTEPDLTPYQCLPNRIPLDEMNPPLKALKGRRLWAARQSLAMNWHEPDDIPQDVLNRILWWDAKGWQTPYPRLR